MRRPGPEPVHILLVDDTPANLQALEAILLEPTYVLVSARSGDEALAQILRHDFAVILLDVAMPGIDGFETARLIKERERSSRVPIIFVTASVFDLEHVFRGYKIGAVDYLRKPLDPFAVRAKVAVFVELWRQKQQILRQERRARELEAYAHEQRWATTLRSIGDAVIATDDQGRVTFLNPVAERLTGWSLLDARGRPVDQVFPIVDERDDRPLESPIIQVIRTGEAMARTNHIRLRGRHGLSHAIEDSGAPVRDEKGKLLGSVLVFRDVTERRREEERRRFLAEVTTELLASLDVHETMGRVARMAVPWLADWCIVDQIDDAGELREVAVAHVDPSRAEELREMRRRWPPNPQHPLRESLARGESVLLEEVSDELLRRSASDADHLAALRAVGAVSAMVVPLLARERLLGAITVVSSSPLRRYRRDDLTFAEDLARRAALAVDNARLYHGAQEAVRTRDEFLSVASHELRTPLTSLLLQLQTMEKILSRTHADPKLQAKIAASVKMADRLAGLVDRLLDVSRISTGRLQLQLDELDLADLVRDVVERFRPQAAREGCRLDLEVEPAPGRWDRLRIEQVVSNLLSNAVKYGPGKPIEIRVAPTGAMARVTVRDHGIGIAPEAVRRIFGRFERAVSLRHYGGMGLGLYVARQIAEAHQGTIRVDSRPGEGALFVLELPREGTAQPEANAGVEAAVH